MINILSFMPLPTFIHKHRLMFSGLLLFSLITALLVGGNLSAIQGAIKPPIKTIKEIWESRNNEEEPPVEEEAGKIVVASVDSWEAIEDDAYIAGKEILVARYNVFAQEEDFKLTKITFENDSLNDNLYERDSVIKSARLRDYEDHDTLGSATPIDGKLTFGDLNFIIEESEVDENPLTLELLVTTNLIGQGTYPGDQVELDFKASGDFEAVGQTSHYVVTEQSDSTHYGNITSSGGYVDVDANEIALYKTIPDFDYDDPADTWDTVSSPCGLALTNGSSYLYCFRARAAYTGNVGLYKLTFETKNITNIDIAKLSTSNGFKLYKYEGNDSGSTIVSGVLAQGTWNNNQVAMIFSEEEQIVASIEDSFPTTPVQYYVLEAPIAFLNPNDDATIYTRLASDTSYVPMGSMSSVPGMNVWSDQTGSSDWTNSYMIEYLPTEWLDLSN